MKCPGNPEHTGVNVIRGFGVKPPHYAKAVCAECGVWIKWLSEEDAEAVEYLQKPITDWLRYYLNEDAIEQIREIVRDEIAKRFGG